jgi:hypothetical protein
MPLQIIFAREDLFGCFAPHIRASESFPTCVCRFVTLAVCADTECLFAASIDAFESEVVRLRYVFTAMIQRK